MRPTFVFAVEGIETIHEFNHLKADIEFNAVRAINLAARDARTAGADRIRAQVNFEKSYLNPAQKRLYVHKQAKRGDMSAIIRARGRPTSLARFIQGAPTEGKGVTLQVKPGRITQIKSGFLIKLRAGNDDIETRFNRGLAIRLRPGETLTNKQYAVKLKSGLYVLYGPSVSQVFMANDETGVAKDLEPDILDQMENEFMRLMELAIDGRI
jgi:hypothetical protein